MEDRKWGMRNDWNKGPQLNYNQERYFFTAPQTPQAVRTLHCCWMLINCSFFVKMQRWWNVSIQRSRRWRFFILQYEMKSHKHFFQLMQETHWVTEAGRKTTFNIGGTTLRRPLKGDIFLFWWQTGMKFIHAEIFLFLFSYFYPNKSTYTESYLPDCSWQKV